MDKDKNEQFEKQFQDLVDKAKLLYPDLEESLTIMDNITAQTTNLQDFLNLIYQTPSETNNNQIVII
jgi:hypothetical protein